MKYTRTLSLLLILATLAFGVSVSAAAITYQVEPMPPDLESRFTAEQLAILEKLNRADLRHLPRLSSLIVPDRWDAGELEYSPLPQTIEQLIGMPKALVVDQPHQIFGAYENGQLVRWGPVSSGRRQHPTPSGAFHLNWRSPGRHSTENPEWYLKWYFNFHNQRGLALHQYALPGLPASHACVRLLERDAQWIYNWGDGWTLDRRQQSVIETGTPIRVIGSYDFGASPPWLDRVSPHPAVRVDF
ncbi:MAG TPA: L,D-transpeptidase [Thermoanaerobaculia bacterium]